MAVLGLHRTEKIALKMLPSNIVMASEGAGETSVVLPGIATVFCK